MIVHFLNSLFDENQVDSTQGLPSYETKGGT